MKCLPITGACQSMRIESDLNTLGYNITIEFSTWSRTYLLVPWEAGVSLTITCSHIPSPSRSLCLASESLSTLSGTPSLSSSVSSTSGIPGNLEFWISSDVSFYADVVTCHRYHRHYLACPECRHCRRLRPDRSGFLQRVTGRWSVELLLRCGKGNIVNAW